MDLAITLNDGDIPLHDQLYKELRRSILLGRLAPGQRLPSTRALSASLRISRATVVQSFAQLIGEGYLEARRGSGTYVSAQLPDRFDRSLPPQGAQRPHRAFGFRRGTEESRTARTARLGTRRQLPRRTSRLRPVPDEDVAEVDRPPLVRERGDAGLHVGSRRASSAARGDRPLSLTGSRRSLSGGRRRDRRRLAASDRSHESAPDRSRRRRRDRRSGLSGRMAQFPRTRGAARPGLGRRARCPRRPAFRTTRANDPPDLRDAVASISDGRDAFITSTDRAAALGSS